MTDTTIGPQNVPSTSPQTTERTEKNLNRVSGLLHGLIEDQKIPTDGQSIESTSGKSHEALVGHRYENDMAMVRLGIATSLFYALRVKHPPSASHSLRVAICLSIWADRLRLDAKTRDRLEVAGLLHDVGKIGIPDAILKKPTRLDIEERSTVEVSPLLSVHILKGCTQDTKLLEIIEYCHHWFANKREQNVLQGQQLPLGARMLAIAEAFDSMTTETVYRSAMSRERALLELSRYAGTQFDPDLTADFHRMLEEHPEFAHQASIERWLKTLSTPNSDVRWSGIQSPSAFTATENPPIEGYFQQLLRHTNDGIAFIDCDGIIREWNATLFEMSGIRPEAVTGNLWGPELLGLAPRDGAPFSSLTCPVLQALKHGSSSSHMVTIQPDPKHDVVHPMNLRISGVTDPQGGTRGVVAIFQDTTRQTNLEKYVEHLNAKVSQDPMTGVANRAEFDRKIASLTESARNGELTFSLIITDIDHFKSVNDTYGHPAGDEAIIQFSKILSNQSRDGDLVARYGGEEFAILCTHCDNTIASKRAEEMRQAFEQTRLSFLSDDVVTASFGVTQFQGGDTADSIVARADRALLRAKENGRNRVIQLGSGGFLPVTPKEEASRQSGWLGWFKRPRTSDEEQAEFRTPVPLDIVVAKIRGYLADHHAEVLHISGTTMKLKLELPIHSTTSRRASRIMAFQVELDFIEDPGFFESASGNVLQRTETLVKASVQAFHTSDRRSSEIKNGIAQVIAGIRSYLMADF